MDKTQNSVILTDIRHRQNLLEFFGVVSIFTLYQGYHHHHHHQYHRYSIHGYYSRVRCLQIPPRDVTSVVSGRLAERAVNGRIESERRGKADVSV
jgi:hypothetical protein